MQTALVTALVVYGLAATISFAVGLLIKAIFLTMRLTGGHHRKNRQ